MMMENVKNLVGNNHRKNFESVLTYLESLGYTNYWSILNARDFGITQNRERVFCRSILNCEKEFKFPEGTDLKIKMNDLLETNVDQSFYLSHGQYTDIPIMQDWIYSLDSNYWKGTMLRDFLEKHRRQVVSVPRNEEGLYPARRLTPRETWRFMGVTDDDYDKASSLVSKTSLYKQSGNRIVVQVLEALYRELFINYLGGIYDGSK